jgi:hypothetical protein
MGSISSKIPIQNAVNYDCPICKETGKTPNMAGRFFIISETECQCNGCNTIFDKSRFYKPYRN